MKGENCGYCQGGALLAEFGIKICDLGVSQLILFKEQSHPGRCIVAYKDHVSEIVNLTDEERSAFFADVNRAANAIHKAFHPDKVNYGAYGDTGCHLHDPVTCLPVLVVSYPDAKARLPDAVNTFLDQWFAGATRADPPPGTRLRLVPCGTAAEKSLLPGFAVPGIGLITENGVLGLGRSAVVFAPRSFGSTAYEALYGNDFM